jgi:2-keto-4-pentenoate hydratase
MSGSFDPDKAASILADAWRRGSLIKELPGAVRPQTMTQGYDVQDRLLEQMGLSSVGWKLGIGSHAQKRQLGVGRSVAGRIPANALHRHGDLVELPNAAPVTVEFEIAYILGRDILPDEAAFPVLDAVSETRVSFELVLSRFIDRRSVGWPSFAADNGACQAVVLGDTIATSELPALVESLIVRVDGQEKARAVTGEDVTDPADALSDLVAIARERGMLLPNGSIISTGTVSRPFNIAASSAHISAQFLGRALAFHTRSPV